MVSYLTRHVKEKMCPINRLSIGHHSIMLSAHQNVNCQLFHACKTGKYMFGRLVFLHFKSIIKPGQQHSIKICRFLNKVIAVRNK